MRTIVIALLLCAFSIEQAPKRKSPISPEGLKHIQQVMATLPPESRLRQQLEEGAHGLGVHYPWMDEMRKAGVKRSLFQIHFIWRGRPDMLKVVRAIYFAEYDRGCFQIKDPIKLDQIRTSGLETTLEDAALRQTEKAQWFLEKPHHLTGKQGASYVELLDDEWLPQVPAFLQPLDTTQTAFDHAIALGDELSIQESLRKGNINLSDLKDALLPAAYNDYPCITKTLLVRGADVNAKNKEGSTPLILAVRARKSANVKVLLDGGADLKVKDRSGQTALSYAERQGDSEIIELLKRPNGRD